MFKRSKTGVPGGTPGGVTRSTLLPILSDPRQLAGKGYIGPAIVTAVATIALLAAEGAQDRFFLFLALYVTFIQCVVVYFLCGRRHAWIAMILVFLFTCAVMMLTPLFDVFAPYFKFPAATALKQSSDLGSSFVGQFIAVGLLEELYKALPLLVLAVVGLCCRSGILPAPFRAVALTEPLDGIVLGAASGAGFAVVETIIQYVPNEIKDYGNLSGLELGIGRLISQLGGHLGYSGILGYFIGLAVLRPKAAPLYLVVGWAIAAGFHGAWNAFHAVPVVQLVINAVVIVFLVAAILKARRISPTRAANFATVTMAAATFESAIATPAAPGPARKVAKETAPRTTGAGGAGLVLAIGPVTRALAAGTTIEPRLLGAAGAGRGRGPIAEVVTGKGGLGLRNLSAASWQARLPTGATRAVAEGQAVPLTAGLIIDFGGVEGQVQAG